jgi:predicted lipid carrier protein YhbT
MSAKIPASRHRETEKSLTERLFELRQQRSFFICRDFSDSRHCCSCLNYNFRVGGESGADVRFNSILKLLVLLSSAVSEI